MLPYPIGLRLPVVRRHRVDLEVPIAQRGQFVPGSVAFADGIAKTAEGNRRETREESAHVAPVWGVDPGRAIAQLSPRAGS
jgi:hypothetical protein